MTCLLLLPRRDSWVLKRGWIRHFGERIQSIEEAIQLQMLEHLNQYVSCKLLLLLRRLVTYCGALPGRE